MWEKVIDANQAQISLPLAVTGAKVVIINSDEQWSENLDAESNKLVGGNLFQGGELSGSCWFFSRFFDLMNDTVNNDKPEINNWYQAKLCIVYNYEMINSACHLVLQRGI